MIVKAATQRLEQGDLADQVCQLSVDFLLFGAEVEPLGIQQGQLVVDAFAITTVGQLQICLAGGQQLLLGCQLVRVGLACDQAIGNFLESGLDGFFILGDMNVFLDFAVFQIGFQTAGIEDRQVDLRLERPGAGAGTKQVG